MTARLPEISFAHLIVFPDAGGRVGGDDAPVDQDRDAIGQIEDDVHVVLDHDERLALGNLPDQGDRLLGFAGVHPRGRFIEHHHIGAAADRHSDLQRPLLGVGEDPRLNIAPRGQGRCAPSAIRPFRGRRQAGPAASRRRICVQATTAWRSADFRRPTSGERCW